MTLSRRTLRAIAVLTIVFLGVSSAPLDDDNFEIDVGKTVENVQSILEAHPELPRLTNEDILVLLNNITAEDKKKIGVPKKDEKIMVVLPFKPTDSDIEDMTDLFTKRPITKYVSSHSYTDVEETTTVASVAQEPEKVVKKQNKGNNGTPKKVIKQKLPVESEQDQKKVNLDSNDIPFKYDDLIDQQSLDTSNIPLGDVSAYQTFKPLPLAYKQEVDVPIDVKNLLKTYDLLENSSKKNQELQEETETEVSYEYDPPAVKPNDKFELVNAEIFPAEMASILTEMGLTKDTVTDESKNSQQLSTGLDPITSYDVGALDETENEIRKRQQSNDASEKTTTESSKDATTSSEGPSLEDLESSFGGSKADDDPSEAELPPPRKNGFYYMVDWNSFLEVGDGDTKVNIRFDPKLGDPQRFIPVTIP